MLCHAGSFPIWLFSRNSSNESFEDHKVVTGDPLRFILIKECWNKTISSDQKEMSNG